jgi:hypothetical protein
MKYKSLLFCILLFLCIDIHAQRHSIYVNEFNSEVKVPNRVITTIRSAVMEGIRNTNRVGVIDALSVNTNPGESLLEDACRFRAAYLLKGDLIAREATDDGSPHRKYHSREDSFKEKFTLRLDLIRTSDGIVICTKNYKETGSASGKDATQFSALENALLNIPYEMRKLVETYFKVYGAVLKAGTDNGKKVKTVYINLGFDDPIKEGIRFDVIEDGMIEGNLIEKKIGEIRIDKIMGPRISLCKVNKGGEEIRAALQQDITLRLVSRQAKLFDD